MYPRHSRQALDKLLMTLDSTPEVLESMPIEEVRKELLMLGVDTRPVAERVTRLFASYRVAAAEEQLAAWSTTAAIDKQFRKDIITNYPWSGADVPRLVGLLGAAHCTLAAQAARILSWLEGNQRDSFDQALLSLVARPLDSTAKLRLLDAVSSEKTSAKVLAYFYDESFKKELPAEQALSWLTPDTEIYPLAGRPPWQLLVALVDVPPETPIKSAWLQLFPQSHVILVSRELQGHALVRCLKHELLDHLAREVAMMNKDKQAVALCPPPIPFALRQEEVDSAQKKLAAKWAILHLPLSDGAGVVMDSGSSCLAAWEVITEQICLDRLAHLSIATNSFQILKHWCDLVAAPQLSETKVELLGAVLDPSHQAFYGPGAREKVMSRNFRPSAVYIGTSGIEFDEKEGILFGYHAGDPELEMKRLYFQCYAKRRIILATPVKIGSVGGRVFDLLSVPDLDARAPIYLVTVAPEPKSKEEQLFAQTKKIFTSEKMQRAIAEKGMKFNWVIVDPHNGDVPKAQEHLVAPSEKGSSAG